MIPAMSARIPAFSAWSAPVDASSPRSMTIAWLRSSSAKRTASRMPPASRSTGSVTSALAAPTRSSSRSRTASPSALAKPGLSVKWLKKLPLATPARATMSSIAMASIGRSASSSNPAASSAARVRAARGLVGAGRLAMASQ